MTSYDQAANAPYMYFAPDEEGTLTLWREVGDRSVALIRKGAVSEPGWAWVQAQFDAAQRTNQLTLAARDRVKMPDEKAARARLEAASAGRWSEERGLGSYEYRLHDSDGRRVLSVEDVGRECAHLNATFAAHAPNDMRLLLALLDATRVEAEKLRNVQMAGWERAASHEDALAAVRTLHRREGSMRGAYCPTCFDEEGEPVSWPCPTATALAVGTLPGEGSGL